MKTNGVGWDGSDFVILYCENENAVSSSGSVNFDKTVLSSPPPGWVELTEKHSIILTEPGFYCVFFCVKFNEQGVTAALMLNSRVVAGTEEYSEDNTSPLCGSAIISINEDLRCQLELAAIKPLEIIGLRVTSGVIMISKFTP